MWNLEEECVLRLDPSPVELVGPGPTVQAVGGVVVVVVGGAACLSCC